MSRIYDFTEEELKLPIEKMELSTRATNTLHVYDVKTLNDLIMAIENGNLIKFRNMGKTSIAEIMNKLEEMQTRTWRKKNARLHKIEQKTAEIKAKIAKHYAKIEELNNCLAQMEKIKGL